MAKTIEEMQAEYLRSMGAGPGTAPLLPAAQQRNPMQPQPQGVSAYAPGLRGTPPPAPAAGPAPIARPPMSPALQAASDAAIESQSATDAQAMHKQKYGSGRGIIGLVRSGMGMINKDEKLAGFQDTARQGLTAARDLAELEEGRDFAEGQAEVVQGQQFDVGMQESRFNETRENNSIAHRRTVSERQADEAFKRSALKPTVYHATKDDGTYGGTVEMYEDDYGTVFRRNAQGEMIEVNTQQEGYVSERVITPQQLRESQERDQDRKDLGKGVSYVFPDDTIRSVAQATNGFWYDTNDGEKIDLTGATPWQKPEKGDSASAAATKLYRGTFDLSSQMDAITAQFDSFTDAQKTQSDQAFKEVVMSWLPGGIERLTSENVVYTDPDVRSYRTKLAKLEGDYSRLMSGLAVTGYEMQDRKRWSPYAEGISEQERRSRLDNLQAGTERQQGIFEEFYGVTTTPQPGRQTSAQVSAPPTAGTVEDGYEFLGGDPTDANNWREVQ